jgi:EAL domain-containing protein (putative c-di-GMP-specific phosphodiesterase class I)/PleD family two-component response regulator
MSNNSTSFNILIQVKSQNDSERIISLFRSAGLNTRVHRITSEPDFTEHLSEQNWHLLIADNQHPEVTLQFSLDAIKASKQHLPVILLSSDTSEAVVKQAIDLGISDVIASDNDAGFLLATKREAENAAKIASYKDLQAEFDELNNRAEKLLSQSDDAIAYVADGIIIQANENFAETFGFADIDDLDCASIIDLVSEEDHKRFKNFMKLADSDESAGQLSFQALKHNGETFKAFLELDKATIEGENCTQLNISTNAASAGSGQSTGSGTIDAATELNNRYYLQDQVASMAVQVASGSLQASLLVYRLDDYENLMSDIFLSGIDLLIKDLASHLQGHISSGDVIARLGNDAVAVIHQQNTEKSLELAKATVKTIEDHIVDLPGRTVQYTCTCAVLALKNKNAVELLDQSFEAHGHIRLSKAKSGAEIFVPQAKAAAKVNTDDLSNIDEALEAESFKLLFQPIMSLMGDAHENYEATVWLTDDKKESYPEEMIAAAGNTKLDRWIILEATKALALHQADGHNTRLLINLTVNALKDDSLPAWIGVAIKAGNLNESSLVFQFREDDLRNNLKSGINTIKALKAAGFMVSVANFGQSDEPFKLTSHIALDFIRIDSHFTETIASGKTDELKALINTAKESKIQTILPEVANAGALATLWQLGCSFIQGAYLQLPSPVMNYEFTEIA